MPDSPSVVTHHSRADPDFRTILGIRFFIGDLRALLVKTMEGGLIVVPSGPNLADLRTEHAYREAVESSDLAITDSGFLVLLWALRQGERLNRISGLRYLRGLLTLPEFRKANAVFWVMPTQDDARTNQAWLHRQRIEFSADHCYIAPRYPAGHLEDRELLDRIEACRPAFVVINIGGGIQERLGHFLRVNLSFRPAIICTGAAIAFLSGRQTNIPPWADRLFLGWLIRCLRNPGRFVPRYWRAARLAPLLFKYGAGRVCGKGSA